MSNDTETSPLVDLNECLNMDDIERAAMLRMNRTANAYYWSATDDLYSKSLNSAVYKSILLRPRVFFDTTRCDTSSSILGHEVRVPFFVSPAARARLGHPDGERGIAKACTAWEACQIISNNASMTPEEICEGAAAGQVFGWQLYIKNVRKFSEDMLARIHKIPSIKFIVLTLDAPVSGKVCELDYSETCKACANVICVQRELDEREGLFSGTKVPVDRSSQAARPSKISPAADVESASATKNGNSGDVKVVPIDTAGDLTWENTLPWLARQTHLPIVLKGLQTHEDAYLASLHPQIKGILLSNHGGRALDTAPPSIHTLLEIRKYCPEVFSKLEVWVDGGIKRGTDIVKALALGAKMVGMGRNALYGLGAGGQAGVERVFEVFQAEVETAMRLLGVESVAELGPQHVNVRAVERDIWDGEVDLKELARVFIAKL